MISSKQERSAVQATVAVTRAAGRVQQVDNFSFDALDSLGLAGGQQAAGRPEKPMASRKPCKAEEQASTGDTSSSRDQLPDSLRPTTRSTPVAPAAAEPTGPAAACPAPAAYGRVELITGPMFAGKTTALLKRVEEERAAGRTVALIKSRIDTRFGLRHVVTHDGHKLPCATTDRLVQALSDPGVMAADCIAIDEAQFFPDLLDFVQCAAEVHRKVVVVAGLSGDWRRQRFGQILDLIPLADSVTQVAGKCQFCPHPSLFTFRLAAEDRQELVGAGETYQPVCRSHYVEMARKRVMHQ